MPNFKAVNYQQTTLIALNFEDQLQPGTFEYAVHYLIDQKLDLSVFYPRYGNEHVGRPAYDPAILLKIVLFAYSKGITSSREMAWCCQHNILFKALSCNSEPHFTTLAAFVSERPEAIEQIFEQVLLVCHEQGLLGNELFAIDGCKMSSNAAKTWSGTFKELAQKRDKLKRLIRHHLQRHQQQDKSEIADESKQQRIAQTIQTLNHAHDKIDRFLNQHTPRLGKGKRPTEVKSNLTDNESAKMTTSKGTLQGYNGIAAVDKKHQIVVDAQAFGEGPEHAALQPVLNNIQITFQRLGISDNIYQDGARITADTGYANEANMYYLYKNNIDGYIPDNQFRSRDPKFADYKTTHSTRPATTKQPIKTHTVIPASEFEFNPVTQTCRCPAGEAMWLRSELIDRHGHAKLFFEGRLTKCRHCTRKQQCLRNPDSPNTRRGHGRQVSFILEKRQRATNYTDWMKHRIDSDKGKAIYRHRMSVVEPVFANLSTNKGLNRFSLRGRKKVQGQWQLYCLVHNIEKLMNYGTLRH